MLSPGLVSITFRSLGPQEIIGLATWSGLRSIEWGADIHVPAGDISRAKEVAESTVDAGLKVSAYGSYYRLGGAPEKQVAFERVLESAVALGAPTIRVWAGTKASADCPPEERRAVIADGLRVADLAARAGLNISIEYHAGTLTDTRESVRALLGEWTHPNIDFLWQPANGEPLEACVNRLYDVLPRLRHVHVFHWWPSAAERRPLAEGEAWWRTYIDIIRGTGRSVDFLLEFVAQDAPEQLLADAATLRRVLESPADLLG